MKCFIIYAKESIRDGKDNAFDWMVQAAKKQGVEAEVSFAEDYEVDGGDLYHLGKRLVSFPDCVLLRTYDFKVGRYFESKGVRVFNGIDALEACQDKMRTYEILKEHKLKTIKTIEGNWTYDEIVTCLGSPFVLKDRFGSKGEGVYLIHNEADFKSYKDLLTSAIYQPFLECGQSDIRVHVIGGQAIAWVKRYNPSDFRSNFSQGGSAVAVDVDDDLLDLAVKGVTALGLDIGGIDILQVGGDNVICEVNGISGFRTIFKIGGPSLPDHIFKMIGGHCDSI